MALPPIKPSGVGTALIYGQQVGQGPGFGDATSADPGFTNPPIIFEPDPPLSGNALNVFIIATGAQASWGGCQVYVSTDNMNYGTVGTIYTGQIQGVLTATFPSGLDPDTTNTLSVDLTESRGQLLTVSQAIADDLLSACYVDGELVSYTVSTLTSTYHYNLTTYIRRGIYGSTIGSHAINTKFGAITASTFRQKYASNLIGKTVYFKFPSFNTTFNKLQSLADCVVYTYVLVGNGLSSSSSLDCVIDIGLASGSSEDWGTLAETCVSSSCDWGLLSSAFVQCIDLGFIEPHSCCPCTVIDVISGLVI